MFEKPQKAQVVRIKIEAVSLDSTSMATSLDGHEWQLRHVDSADRELARQLFSKGYSEGGWSGNRSIRAPH